jgi:hypothetical protein
VRKFSLHLLPISPDGGIGRRVRLKIWFQQWSAGSIPVLGTTTAPQKMRGFVFGYTVKNLPEKYTPWEIQSGLRVLNLFFTNALQSLIPKMHFLETNNQEDLNSDERF